MRQQEPGLSGPLGPLELIKHIPGEAFAASDRRRWVGLEALRYREQPPDEVFAPPLTHHWLLLGAVLGALYAGLVGAVHLGVSGRWDRVPAFAVGCVLVGALFGLLGGIKWARSGAAAPDSSPRQQPVVHPSKRAYSRRKFHARPRSQAR
jgi:hypothetical protein